MDWDTVVSKNGESRKEHIKRHTIPNYDRNSHTVFHYDFEVTIREAWKHRALCTPTDDTMGGVIYNIPAKNAGYESGKVNTGKICDFVTVIVLKNTSSIISAFPSDGTYGRQGGNRI